MRSRRKVTAEYLWRAAGDAFDNIVREFLTRARAAEQAETGHDCGHRFEIWVRTSTHGSGPGEHTDADYYDPMRPVEVRAHNLREALLLAATLPLGDWFDPEADPEPPPLWTVLPPKEDRL